MNKAAEILKMDFGGYYSIYYLFENQLSKLIEAATPCVPFVGCAWRLITDGIHAELLLDVLGSLNTTHVFLAATAHEEQLDILGETI